MTVEGLRLMSVVYVCHASGEKTENKYWSSF